MTPSFIDLLRPHLCLLGPGQELAPDASLGELGLDSMASVALVLELEQHFGRLELSPSS